MQWQRKILFLFLFSFLGVSFKLSVTVSIVNGQFLVNGERFFIRGVCYSPVPIGETISQPPYGDYFTDKYAYIWKRDFSLIKKMGANVIRLYGWNNSADHTLFLDEAYANGLMVIPTYWMAGDTPIKDPQERNTLKQNFVKQIQDYRGHPAILMWSFGNELNGPWNKFLNNFNLIGNCGWSPTCSFNTNPSAACSYQAQCMYSLFFQWLDENIAAGKAAGGVPIISPFADIDNFIGDNPSVDKVPLLEHYIPNLEIWAFQLYRGKSFGDFFARFRAETKKLLLITEYGIDAYNDACGWPENSQQVCFNMVGEDVGGDIAPHGKPFIGCHDPAQACRLPGEEIQADWDEHLSIEILNNSFLYNSSGQAIGGIIMSWIDEYWKGSAAVDICAKPCPVTDFVSCRGIANMKNFVVGGPRGCMPKAHFTCANNDSSYHDLCGYFLPSAPDRYSNEEWYGIATPISCHIPANGQALDSLRLRPVYSRLQRLWSQMPTDLEATRTATALFDGVNPVPGPIDCQGLLPCYTCCLLHPNLLINGSCAAACLLQAFPSKHPPPPQPLPPAPTPQSDWEYLGVPVAVFVSLVLVLVCVLLCAFCICFGYSQSDGPIGETVPLLSHQPD